MHASIEELNIETKLRMRQSIIVQLIGQQQFLAWKYRDDLKGDPAHTIDIETWIGNYDDSVGGLNSLYHIHFSNV